MLVLFFIFLGLLLAGGDAADAEARRTGANGWALGELSHRCEWGGGHKSGNGGNDAGRGLALHVARRPPGIGGDVRGQ